MKVLDERYSVDPIDGFDEEQYNIQSLSLDWATNIHYLCLLVLIDSNCNNKNPRIFKNSS